MESLRTRLAAMSAPSAFDKVLDEPKILVSAGLIAAATVILLGSAAGWTQGPKVVEILLQFLLVAVLGGGIAYFYRRAEDRQLEKRRISDRDREGRAARRAALEEFRRSIVEAYHAAKKVRRSLKAVSFTPEGGRCSCERQSFESLMADLEEAQLRAEALVEEVFAQPHLFASEVEDLKTELRTAEKYLRALLRQYENEYAARRSIGATDLIALSAPLVEFAGHPRDPESVRRKSPDRTSYHAAMSAARRRVTILIEQNTPDGTRHGSLPRG
jgi:hypothetical protein